MAGVGKTSVLRMSGINSGLDTEAIVEAMTAATKLKITTNQRKVLKLEAQQEAYRGIMDKINEFKDKYFDILNSSSYLKGASGFNKYAAKISSNGAEVTPPGVKVTTNSAAIPGNYKVEVKAVATQSKYVSTALDSQNNVDLSKFNDSTATYAMKVTVGSQSKVISFQGGNEADVLTNINRELETFGKSNNNEGLVSVKADGDGNYVFTSLEKKAITTSDGLKLENSVSFTGLDFETGSNSITVTINGETKNISLETLDQEHYSSLFTTDPDEIGDDGFAKNADAALKNHFLFYVKDMYSDHLGKEYEKFMANQGDYAYSADGADGIYYKSTGDYEADVAHMSVEQKRIFDEALAAQQNKQWQDAYDKMALDLYNNSPAGKITGDNYVPYNIWLDDFKQTYDMDDFKADRTGQRDAYDVWVRDKAIQSGEVDVDDEEAYAAWASDYKKIYDFKYFQEQTSNPIGKYNDFVDAEYERFVLYEKDLYLKDNPGDTNFDSFVPTDETTWKDDYKANYSVDTFKKYMLGDDVTVAEDKYFYSLGYSEYDAFVKYSYLEKHNGLSESEFIEQHKNAAGAIETASYYNTHSMENSIKATTFEDGTKLRVNYTYEDNDPSKKITGVSISAYREDTDADGNKVEVPVELAITSNSGYNFGLAESNSVSNTISTATKLSELLGDDYDVEPTYKPKLDEDGKVVTDTNGNPVLSTEIDKEGQYKMTLNGVDFSFDASTTVSQMMARINASDANVTMTFSSLTNTFEITNKSYGKGNDFTIDGNDKILRTLGFSGSTYQEGTNLELEINGVSVQTASNNYTIDGTTFSFNSLTEVGTKFEVEISRDTDKIKDLVRDFVKDYNELVKFVYGYVDEKPKSDYHFLTDSDKEDMALSDKQEELWDTAAKKGILYNDSTLTTIMAKFRTALYSANTGVEESEFALFSMGITTSSNFRDHGLLVINEDKFNEAFEKNFEDITRLFTNSSNGIMTQFEKVIDSAVKPTGNRGERGTLVDKAGVANGASTTDNTIYSQIKSLNTMIDSLERRYEQQQDRYWSVYTALEKQMGQLNSQTGYISQLMGSGQ